MNLDLLKKLVLLANHNSNENEANSAARRVCKMLQLSNFSLQADIPMKETGSTMSDEEYDSLIDKEWDKVWKHVNSK